MGSAAGPNIVEDGLVLALDAGNTQSYPGSGSTWTDLSGKGNDGTLYGSPSYSNTNGGNFNFDEVDDYVDLGSSVINSTAYTKVAWIRPESACRNIISSSASTDGHVMWMSSGSSTVYAGHNGSWSSSNARVSHRPNNPGDMLNQWWCVVVTFSTSSGWAMYFNGELVDTDSNTDALNNASLNTYISAYGAGANLFDGDIPVVQIYNRALTASEVKQNYNALRGRYGY